MRLPVPAWQNAPSWVVQPRLDLSYRESNQFWRNPHGRKPPDRSTNNLSFLLLEIFHHLSTGLTWRTRRGWKHRLWRKRWCFTKKLFLPYKVGPRDAVRSVGVQLVPLGNIIRQSTAVAFPGPTSWAHVTWQGAVALCGAWS